MRGTYWSQSETADLRNLVLAGLSNREIAERTGRTIQAVYNKIYRSGLSISALSQPRPRAAVPFNSYRGKAHQKPAEGRTRISVGIWQIEAPVPAGATLGDVVTVAGREMVFIAYRGDGAAVVVADGDVIVVGK